MPMYMFGIVKIADRDADWVDGVITIVFGILACSVVVGIGLLLDLLGW